jgi:hypothetical protein
VFHVHLVFTTHYKILQLTVQCLTLGRVGEYSCVVKTFEPMTLIIPLDDTIVAMCQLHPLPSNRVPLLIFYY